MTASHPLERMMLRRDSILPANWSMLIVYLESLRFRKRTAARTILSNGITEEAERTPSAKRAVGVNPSFTVMKLEDRWLSLTDSLVRRVSRSLSMSERVLMFL